MVTIFKPKNNFPSKLKKIGPAKIENAFTYIFLKRSQ